MKGPLKVSFLIHPYLNEWDLPILTFLFCQDDIDEILKIPLASRNSQDIRVWHNQKSGKYSMSPTYHLVMSLKQQDQNVTIGSSLVAQQQNWNFVWRIKIMNKVKHFLWRALHNALRTSSELNR